MIKGKLIKNIKSLYNISRFSRTSLPVTILRDDHSESAKRARGLPRAGTKLSYETDNVTKGKYYRCSSEGHFDYMDVTQYFIKFFLEISCNVS